jgi:hypothetical protein
MSATTLTAPVAVSNPNKLRYAVVAVAIIGLLALAFVFGRWTSSDASSTEPAVTPTTQVHVAPSAQLPCNVGQPC